MDLSPLPFVNATANLWNPRMGDPSEPGINRSKNKLSFKGKMPAGTYIFVSRAVDHVDVHAHATD
jgi:hypothetical protein